jgi:chaperone modulatory protein CbpM
VADDIHEALFFDELASLTLADLCEASGLTGDELRDLLDEGALAPLAPGGERFDAHAVVVAREAWRVRREFALDDVHAVCVVLRFEERLRALEREIAALRARSGIG